MKPTVNEKLDATFNLEPSPASQEIVTVQPAEVVSTGNDDKDMEYDFDVARRTLHNLVEKGNELVDNANFFAKEKQDSRSVEAAAMAQKEARDTALALIGLRKTKKEIERESGKSGGDTITQNNAVFIGSTGELLKQMKELNANGALKDALRVIDVTSETLNTDEE
jgi:hypothetical protein